MKPYEAVIPYLATKMMSELHDKLVAEAQLHFKPHPTHKGCYKAKSAQSGVDAMRVALLNNFIANPRVCRHEWFGAKGITEYLTSSQYWGPFGIFQQRLLERPKVFSCFSDPSVLDAALQDEDFCKALSPEDGELIMLAQAESAVKVIPQVSFAGPGVYVTEDAIDSVPPSRRYQHDSQEVNLGLALLKQQARVRILNDPNIEPSRTELNYFILPCQFTLESPLFSQTLLSLVCSAADGKYAGQPIVFAGVLQTGANHFINYFVLNHAGKISVLLIDPTARKYLNPCKDDKSQLAQQLQIKFSEIFGDKIHILVVPANQQTTLRDCAILCLYNLEAALTRNLLSVDAQGHLTFALDQISCHALGKVDWDKREFAYPESLVAEMLKNREVWAGRFAACSSEAIYNIVAKLGQPEEYVETVAYDYQQKIQAATDELLTNYFKAWVALGFPVFDIQKKFVDHFQIPTEHELQQYANTHAGQVGLTPEVLLQQLKLCLDHALRKKRVEAITNAFAKILSIYSWSAGQLTQDPFSCIMDGFLIDVTRSSQWKLLTARETEQLTLQLQRAAKASHEKHFAAECRTVISQAIEKSLLVGSGLDLVEISTRYSTVVSAEEIEEMKGLVEQTTTEALKEEIKEIFDMYCLTIRDITTLLSLKRSDLSSLPCLTDYAKSIILPTVLADLQSLIDQRIAKIMEALLIAEFKQRQASGYFSEHALNSIDDFYQRLLPRCYGLHTIPWQDSAIHRISAPLIQRQIEAIPQPALSVPANPLTPLFQAIAQQNIAELLRIWSAYSRQQHRVAVDSFSDFIGVKLTVAKALDWMLLTKFMSDDASKLLPMMLACITQATRVSWDLENSLISTESLTEMLKKTNQTMRTLPSFQISNPIQALHLTQTAMSHDNNKLIRVFPKSPNVDEFFFLLLSAKLGQILNLQLLKSRVPFQHAKPICLGDLIHTVVYLSQEQKPAKELTLVLQTLWPLVSEASVLEWNTPLTVATQNALFSAIKPERFVSLMNQEPTTPLQRAQRELMMNSVFWQHSDFSLRAAFSSVICHHATPIFPLFLCVITLKAGECELSRDIASHRDEMIQYAKGKTPADVADYLLKRLPFSEDTLTCRELQEYLTTLSVKASASPVALLSATNPVVVAVAQATTSVLTSRK